MAADPIDPGAERRVSAGDAQGRVSFAAPGKRRRRSREQARGEIVGAAEAFLRERPFRDLSVEEVMARTSLSRSSFYVYFRDRYELLLQLVQEIGDEFYAMAERWYRGGPDARAGIRAGLEGVVAVYTRHGRVLRAISDAASSDPMVEDVYRALVQRFIDATAQRIAEHTRAGETSGLDPRESGAALVWMVERYLTHAYGGPVALVAPDVAARTLDTIFTRALFGLDRPG